MAEDRNEVAETLRDQIHDLSPPWLQEEVGGTILRAVATVCDALCDRTNEAVKLAFPGVGSYTALGYIGNDRNIERGPAQTNAGYSAQLQRAFDTWRNAGGSRTILSQLRYFFAPGDGPPMRTVTGRALWHVIDPVTGVVTRYAVGTNWVWGNNRWWYGWAIIDGTGLWTQDLWDDTDDSVWGDGGVWGSDMTEAEAISLNAIVKKWKPGNTYDQIIIVFDSSLFEHTDTSPPNPNGNGEDYSWRAGLDANFFMPQGT